MTTRDGLDWQTLEPTGIVAKDSNHVPIANSIVERADRTLVLVGAEALDDISSGDAAVWRSRDGIEWERVPAARSLRDAEMLAVTASADGLVAVGADGFPGGNVQLPGLRAPAVWRSTDGAAWTRTTLARAADPMLIEGIAPISAGWVAWGGGAPPGSGAVWTSTDGEDWSRSANPAGAPWGPVGRILEAPNGALVAVGSRWRDHGDPLPGIWGSDDGGVSWSPVGFAAQAVPGPLWDAVSTTSGMVATGAGARVVKSSDGRTWEESPSPTLPPVTLRHLFVVGGSLVAFGSTDSEDATSAGIWRRDLGR